MALGSSGTLNYLNYISKSPKIACVGDNLEVYRLIRGSQVLSITPLG